MNSAATSHIQKLEALQNKAARIITGCPLKTNTDDLIKEARLEPIHTRGKFLAASLYEKAIRRDPNEPLHQAAAQNNTCRLKSKNGLTPNCHHNEKREHPRHIPI